jgi:dihydrofolate reductase
MNALPKLVASRTLESVDWNNSRVTADIVPELKRLKETEEAKTLYVFGSADLTHSLLEAGLVDELMFCTVPVVLGQRHALLQAGAADRPGTPGRPSARFGFDTEHLYRQALAA